MEKGKPRIGLLTLMFSLYDAIPSLEPEMLKFGKELVEVLGAMAEVDWSGICKTRDQVEEAVTRFETGRADLIVVVLLTYAPSHAPLKALVDTKLPILVLNTQRLQSVTSDMDPEELIRNHGIHGVQDLTNVLLRAGRGFKLVTGHYRDPVFLKDVEEWCLAASTANHVISLRLGTLGNPLQGMGDFAIDETGLLAKLGVEVLHLSQRELAQLADEAPEEAIKSQMKMDRDAFEFSEEATEKEHEESSRLEWALRETLQKGRMNAFTVNFMDISKGGLLQTQPFLASSKMLAEGYGYAGEGDILTALAVAMMQGLADSANFTEMFTMDFAGNSILMSHMGEGNHLMAREDMRVEMVPSTLKLAEVPVRPLLLRFALKPGEVTLANLTVAEGGKLKLTATEGRVLDFPPIEGVMTPHYKFQPEGPLPEFLTALSYEGTSHHFALAYGRWSSILGKVADILGIGYVKV